MFGPLAWRFWRRHLHAMHRSFGPQWHFGPGGPRGSPWGHGGPHWGSWWHAGHGHHHGPTREQMIAHLEQYQRDLEEETIAVAARIKELRAAGAPGVPPGNQPGSEPSPPPGGPSNTSVL